MGAWTLTDNTTTIDFDVLSGDVGYEDVRETSVTVSLSGVRYVHRGPLLPAIPAHGDLIFDTEADFLVFRTLARSGSTLTLTDYLADTYTVIVTKLTGIKKDYATAKFAAKVEWVGV